MMKLLLLIVLSVPVGLSAWAIAPPALPVAPSLAEMDNGTPYQGLLPAFPGATGYGANALETCRALPMEVIQITDLSNFTAAILSTNPSRYTIVIFRVGGQVSEAQVGDINLGNKNCLYVAGQTAPGQGFQFQRPDSGFLVLLTNAPPYPVAQDIVWRYTRFRVMLSTDLDTPPLSFLHARRVIFDHNSISGTSDSWWGFTPLRGTIEDITMSWNLTCSSRSTAYENSGNTEKYFPNRLRRLTFHHNYGCHASHRYPTVGNGDTTVANTTFGPETYEWLNNLTYRRYGQRLGIIKPGIEADFRGNLIRNAHEDGTGFSDNHVWWYVTSDLKQGACFGPARHPPSSIHMDDNVVIDKDNNVSPTSGYGLMLDKCGSGALPDSVRRATVVTPRPTYDFTIDAAATLNAAILPTVGVYRVLNCDGTWRTAGVRDTRDQEWIDDYNNGTGPTARQFDPFLTPHPTIDPGTPCPDVDGDGMPDEFELVCTGSATALAVDGDISGDGYFNMEEYINGTNADGRTLNWIDNASNEDGYRVERDTGSGFSTLVSLGAGVTTYFDPDARPGHDYRVFAFNATGDSSPTLTVSATCR